MAVTLCLRKARAAGVGAPLLWPGRRGFSRVARNPPRLRVVMDIDECMIHTFDIEEEEEYRLADSRSSARSEVEGLITKAVTCEDGIKVKLHHRPGLELFLQQLSNVADVFAFTAGLPVYARPVIKSIDHDGKIFQQVWFRDSCKLWKNKIHVKDLTVLGDRYDPTRTVLVDNALYSFIPQPSNGIWVPNFHDDPKDNALSEVLSIVKSLQDKSDVRPVLHDMFNLQEQVDGMKLQLQ